MDFINEVEVLCDPETTFQITEEGKEFLKNLKNEDLESD
jgi:predicted transcriptional regulator